jgi:hypothetical protein
MPNGTAPGAAVAAAAAPLLLTVLPLITTTLPVMVSALSPLVPELKKESVRKPSDVLLREGAVVIDAESAEVVETSWASTIGKSGRREKRVVMVCIAVVVWLGRV